jgi:hypothetical protein
MTVEQPEQHFYLAGLRQRVAVEPYRLGIGHPVPESKPHKPHERQPIADLILDLVRLFSRTDGARRLTPTGCKARSEPAS